MGQLDSERIVLDIPVSFTAEELAKLCGIKGESSAAMAEIIEDALPLVNEWAAPKAIIKWAQVDRVEGDCVTVEGVTFRSKVVADKLKSTPRVFLSVITAGRGLEKCEDLDDNMLLGMFNGALIHHAVGYTVRYMKDVFNFDGSSMLQPGSLPDWPIVNNIALFNMIGNTEEIGVSLNGQGYINPWNSTSNIHFSGDGYYNCSLCKNYNCIGRRARFDRDEYIRIFGTEP